MGRRGKVGSSAAGRKLKGVTREEAQGECARLAREHPDRETHRFVPREGDDGEWTVLKIGLPPVPIEPLGQETRADERPPTPGDPPDGHTQRSGSPWAGPF